MSRRGETPDPREILIDGLSTLWCWRLGQDMRARATTQSVVRANQWCPFREGTPHYRHWTEGWRAHRGANGDQHRVK
ncbi:MAG: hypothetical protein L0Y66_20540 [Myxococcaceae bacterium]|nr:hypothetical protein [Myxococcaceae bacterium]